MIEIDQVTKAYDGRPVVDRLSLTIPTGAFCVLLGPSGCGKSTTLRMINRLVPFDTGAIRVNGEDIGSIPAEVLRRRIGYAIQAIGLFPHRRVADNIAIVPRLLRWPEQRVRDRVTELLQLLRLDPDTYRAKYPHQLSGGEQQRVGVARALAADPELLLMDEPFAAVDPITRHALQGEMLRIHRATGKSIVFVTHDIEEALRLASVIAVMEKGRLAQWGAPLELLDRPASPFVAQFLGGDAGHLHRLALRKVRDHVRPGEIAPGQPLPADASLRDALAEMAVRHTDRLAVWGPDGTPLGIITAADLVT